MEVTPPDTQVGPAGADPVGEMRSSLRQYVKIHPRNNLYRTMIITALSIVAAPLLFCLGMAIHYQFVAKPGSLRSAGPIALGRMETDVSPAIILPKPSQHGNAAFYY